MSLRALPACLCLAACLNTVDAGASPPEAGDPLDSETLLSLRIDPRISLQQDAGAPCRQALAPAVLDIVDAVELALCRNPQTREAWANARAQAALVGVARAAYLPGLDARLSGNRTVSGGLADYQRSASLTLSWLLYDFGARNAKLESARQLLLAAAATLDASVQNVLLLAMQTYYNAQAARAALVAAQESEKTSHESLAAAQVRYRIGSGTPADQLQAQTAWSQSTLNRIKAEGSLRNALGTLANVMGFDANLPLTLADIDTSASVTPNASFEGDLATMIEEARLHRPDLKAAEAQLNAAQAATDHARAAGMPTLSLSAGPNWQRLGELASHGNSIGLSVSAPLFSGFETHYRVRNAEQQSAALKAQRDGLRQQIALDVWKAYQSLTTATQTLRTTQDLLASAGQSERVALGRYKAGVGSILDLLNTQSALATARQQRVQAILDWQIYRATLAQALGTLDQRLLQANATGQGQP